MIRFVRIRSFRAAHALPLLTAAALALPSPAASQEGAMVRIVQTNSAGNDAHLIDPVTFQVVGVVSGLGKPHGVAASEDGTRYYFTNEEAESLDVIDTRTLELVNRIPLAGTPHNPAVSHRAGKAYVPLINRGFVQVVDLVREEVIAEIPTAGGVHNMFVTPDHRHVVAGMIGARTLSVIDTESDEILWSLSFPPVRGGGGLDDGGVRPMAIEANPDGTTKRIFVQISGFHGFQIVDWEQREVVERIAPPSPPLSRRTSDGIQGSPMHGAVATPAMTSVWAASRATGHIYGWSLPDLTYLGAVETGSPSWLTVTPDSRFVYVGVASTNETVAVDIEKMEVAARIPVGQTPKRIQALMVVGDAR